MPLIFQWLPPKKRCRQARVTAVLSVVMLLQQAYAANYTVKVEAPVDVKDMLQTYLDIVRYQPREDIKDEYLEHLVDQTPEQVASLLATKGYFDPHTTITDHGKVVDLTDIVNLTDKPELTITIKPGERTIVKSAVLKTTNVITQQDPQRVGELVFDWSLQEDEPFSQDEWSLSKTLLLRKVRSEAYAAAKLTTEAIIEPEKKKATLNGILDSGPYFTLGEPQINGLNRYPESVIKNVNTIKVGEAYNREKLLKYQKRLQDLPYFSSVLVDVSSDPANAQLSPILVQVVELPTQSFKGLVGYSTDLGARANVQYNHFNVFKRGWILDTKYDWQQKLQEGRVSLTTPQNPNHYQWSLVGKITQDQKNSSSVKNDNAILGLHRTRKLDHSSISYDVDYYFNRWTVLKQDTVTRRALFAGVTWAFNKVDNPSFPRKGYAVEASLGGAAKGLGSSANFLRAYGRFRYFIPFLKQDSLVLRVEGGAVLTTADAADIPEPLLFYAGGSSSIRGYTYKSIGTAIEDTTSVLPAKFLVTASAEYTHWFNKTWGAAVFYDVGTAADNLKSATLNHGIGAGIRWNSPVGPIHFDLAYGYPRRKIAPHVSVGILF